MKYKIFYNQNSTHDFRDYGIDIPLLNERILNTVETLSIEHTDFPEFNDDDLLLVHSKEFVDRVKNQPEEVVIETYELRDKEGNYNRFDPKRQRKPLINFIAKSKIHMSGTYMAARQSLRDKFSYHLGGGMHHSMSFKPGGFCMFNDIVYAIKKLQREGLVKKCGVIDLDCHKGDGTAEITKDDESITTLSIHMARGWPLDGDPSGPSFTSSNFDIPISESENYHVKLKNGLVEFFKEQYDLVLVVHGVDVWEHDVLESSGGIELTKEEILLRDKFVFHELFSRNIPQAWCLGGGYGKGVSNLYVQFLKNLD